MDERLSDEQSQLRDSAARLCGDLGGAKGVRRLRDEGSDLNAEAWEAIREAQWLRMLVPEARGGLGLGLIELYAVIEQAGRHMVMTPLLESIALAWLLGAARDVNAALPALLEGDRILIPALDGDGWAFRPGASVAAKRQGNALHLNGTARAPAFAPSAAAFLLHAHADGEGLLCLVAAELPGCDVAISGNVDGSHAGLITLTDVALDPVQIVARGEEAVALAAKLADLLALGSAIMLLGACESALALALEHVKTRRQFGQPLGSFQALQHRLADNYVDLELNRSLLHRICIAWDAGTAAPAMIAGAKARSVRVATEIMRNALQLHGAIGYTDEHDIGVLWKHALALSARYGNELTQAARFARLTAEEA